MGLNVNSAKPTTEVKEVPKAPPVPTRGEAMDFITRNNNELVLHAKKLIDAAEDYKAKAERDIFKANLELAQANILKMSEILNDDKQANKEMLLKLIEETKKITDSNAIITDTVKARMVEFKADTLKAVKDVIDKNGEGTQASIKHFEESTQKAVKGFEESMKKTLKANEEVAEAIAYTHQIHGWKTYGLYAWRWMLTMAIFYMLKHIFGIDNAWSAIKVFTGLALFF